MAVDITLPDQSLDPSPSFSIQVMLDGVNYALEIDWNPRDSAWYMNVLDDLATVVYLAGLKLVLGTFIGLYNTSRPFPGCFVVVDSSRQQIDAGQFDLGKRVTLTYFSGADVAALFGT